jgi:hypothetical protein
LLGLPHNVTPVGREAGGKGSPQIRGEIAHVRAVWPHGGDHRPIRAIHLMGKGNQGTVRRPTWNAIKGFMSDLRQFRSIDVDAWMTARRLTRRF